MPESTPMRIALGSDHTGLPLRERVKTLLEGLGHEVVDFGCFTAERCDYPDYCRPAAEAVRSGECHRCIVFGGSGNGEAIVAMTKFFQPGNPDGGHQRGRDARGAAGQRGAGL